MASPTPTGAMFARIANVYDLLNHVLSMGLDIAWRKELALAANPGKNGLLVDLAAGTLDVSLAILAINPEANIIGIDFCPEMLKAGKHKINKSEIENHLAICAGDAFSLPVKQGAASSLAIAFGIRNINPRKQAFAQMLETLKPGGKACILEFGSGKERIWGGIYNFYLNRILPGIGKLLAKDKPAYEYLAKTIREFPKAETLAREMEEAGFANVGWKKLTSGIVCLHWGFKPE